MFTPALEEPISKERFYRGVSDVVCMAEFPDAPLCRAAVAAWFRNTEELQNLLQIVVCFDKGVQVKISNSSRRIHFHQPMPKPFPG